MTVLNFFKFVAAIVVSGGLILYLVSPSSFTGHHDDVPDTHLSSESYERIEARRTIEAQAHSIPSAADRLAGREGSSQSHSEQSEQSIADWCKIDYGWNPNNCYCGAERPSWTASQAQQAGHRVSIDVLRDSDGRIRRIRVHDFFRPDNGDALSGIANVHTYFQTLEECKSAVASRDMP
jgi:hypothetical protein